MATRRAAPARRVVRRRAAPRQAKEAEPEGLAALRRRFESDRITRVKLGGFDIDGIFRGKYVSLEKFWSSARSSLGFCDVIFGWDSGDVLYDNATLTGWHTGYPDTGATIDLSTYRPIPWEPGTAAFLLDYVKDGKPHPASPRGLLARMIDRANAMGFRPKYSAEFEFFMFRETPQSVREKGYRNLTPLTPGMFGYSWLRASEQAPLVQAIMDGCNAFRLPIEGMHTETGPGVYEVAIAYDDAMEAADRAALFKTVAKEIAARHGVMPCFMAKWNADLPGCSGHVHQSLWNLQGTVNRFVDESDALGMSAAMKAFLAGQVKLMPELTALISPTVNSYKRYVPGVWAPLNATWGTENRTCALRVIGAGKDPGKALRIEHRQAAADINPYIAMATMLGAGLWGIKNGLKPPPPTATDATAARAPPLPRTLPEALRLLEKSTAAREILGQEFLDHYIRTRDWEARLYQKAVTDWELSRYFEII